MFTGRAKRSSPFSLGAYEAGRARWPTFADYVPELIVALDVAGGMDSTAR